MGKTIEHLHDDWKVKEILESDESIPAKIRDLKDLKDERDREERRKRARKRTCMTFGVLLLGCLCSLCGVVTGVFLERDKQQIMTALQNQELKLKNLGK